jgi:hypothetical protein
MHISIFPLSASNFLNRFTDKSSSSTIMTRSSIQAPICPIGNRESHSSGLAFASAHTNPVPERAVFFVDIHFVQILAPFIRKQGCPEFDFKAALQEVIYLPLYLRLFRFYYFIRNGNLGDLVFFQQVDFAFRQQRSRFHQQLTSAIVDILQ